jgi:membrane protease YdiL (CAAX protease family)
LKKKRKEKKDSNNNLYQIKIAKLKLIKTLYSKWKNMKPLSFILTTTFLNFIFMIPIVLVLVYFDIDDNEIGGIDIENFSFLGFFFTVVIFGPIFETLIGQLIPIKLIQKILRNKLNIIAVLVSAIIFSLGHFGYSIWYSLISFPLGLLLAKTYIIFQKRKESSFWVTTAVHSLRNLIAVISIYSGIE